MLRNYVFKLYRWEFLKLTSLYKWNIKYKKSGRDFGSSILIVFCQIYMNLSHGMVFERKYKKFQLLTAKLHYLTNKLISWKDIICGNMNWKNVKSTLQFDMENGINIYDAHVLLKSVFYTIFYNKFDAINKLKKSNHSNKDIVD